MRVSNSIFITLLAVALLAPNHQVYADETTGDVADVADFADLLDQGDGIWQDGVVTVVSVDLLDQGDDDVYDDDDGGDDVVDVPSDDGFEVDTQSGKGTDNVLPKSGKGTEKVGKKSKKKKIEKKDGKGKSAKTGYIIPVPKGT